MSGGYTVPIPLFLQKGNNVLASTAAVVQLFRRGKKREAAIEAQAKVVEFHTAAVELYHKHNRLVGDLADWIADHPEILDAAKWSRTSRYEGEAK